MSTIVRVTPSRSQRRAEVTARLRTHNGGEIAFRRSDIATSSMSGISGNPPARENASCVMNIAWSPVAMPVTRDRRLIIDLAAKHKLPSIWEWPEQVEDGGLMSYGTSLSRLHQRLALYVDRIFKGAMPSDMPVEQPTAIELVINLKTARALGLTLAPPLLLRADRLIE